MHVQLNTNLCRPKAKQQKPKYTPREWNWLGPKLWALNLPRRSACYKWHLNGVIFAVALVCATHINYIRRRQRSTQTGNVRWNDESTRRTLFSFRSFPCVRLPFRFCYVARLGHCGQTAQWWIDASRQFSLTTLFASSLTILHRINPRSEKKVYITRFRRTRIIIITIIIFVEQQPAASVLFGALIFNSLRCVGTPHRAQSTGFVCVWPCSHANTGRSCTRYAPLSVLP